MHTFLVLCGPLEQRRPEAITLTRESLQNQIPHSLEWQLLETPQDQGQFNCNFSACLSVLSDYQSDSDSIIGWITPGDVYAADTLHQVAQFFQAHPNIDVVYGDLLVHTLKNGPCRTLTSHAWSVERLREECYINPPSVFLRKRVLESHPPQTTSLQYWADYAYWLQLADAGVRFGHLPRRLAQVHLRMLDRERNLEALEEVCSFLQERNGHVPANWMVKYGQTKANSSHAARSVWIPGRELQCSLAAVKRWPSESYGKFEQHCRIVSEYAQQCFSKLKRTFGSSKNWLPAWLQPLLRVYLKPRLSQLRHHAPKPLRLPKRYFQTKPPEAAPKISIVTPNYNSGAFLGTTLRSVLDQQYPSLEYLVQDGGSTDESVSVLKQFETQLSGWISQPDNGQSHALNLGMQQTSGEILAYLNSDDLLLPGTLAYVADFFANHPEIDVVYGHRVLIDQDGHDIGRWILPPHDDQVLSFINSIPQETMFWRRSIWEKVGAAFDETLHFAMDWDLILRFRSVGARFARLPRFLGAFRIHEDQKTMNHLNTIGEREIQRLRHRSLGYIPDDREVRRAVRPYFRQHWWRDKLYLGGFLAYSS